MVKFMPYQTPLCILCRAMGGHPFKATPSVTLGDAIQQLLNAKRSAGRRYAYLKSLEWYLNRFAKNRESNPIATFGPEHIERFLEQFTGNSRETNLNRISTLFSYAVRRGMIGVNPCDRIERGFINRKAPRILTPQQSATLLKITPTICKPYLILCLYTGIRPHEAMRLNWTDVCLKNKSVTIDSAASKVRQRRIVPLPDYAISLLKKHPIKKGPIAPSPSTIRRWIRGRAAGAIGGWRTDILRHTCASYLLALHQDAGKVSTWLGNSPKILMTHYNGLATKDAALQFFHIESEPKEK
jgi:integrase